MARCTNVHLAVPSYMAVMSDVTDAVDGFPVTPHALFPFLSHNQAVAHVATKVLLWHGTCDKSF
jgi:hypothetical protein